MKQSNKGQIFSTDFIISIGIFIFILNVSILIWNNINSQIDQGEISNKFQTKLISTSTLLLETTGLPKNWEKLDPQIEKKKISQIGLAIKSNVLSYEKITALKNLPYDDAKEIMGLETENIYIEILDASGNILNMNGKDMKFGLLPINAENIYKISRPVIMENDDTQTIGVMNVILW